MIKKSLHSIAAVTMTLGLCLSLTAQAQLQSGSGTTPTYLDEAEQVELLEKGQGWQRLRIYPDTVSTTGTEMIAITSQGLRTAPLPASEIAELSQDFGLQAGVGAMILVNRELAEAKAAGQGLPPEYAAYAGGNKSSCFGWKDKEKTKTWDFDGFNEDHTFPITNNINGTYQVSLPASGQATAIAKYRVKSFLCVPYKFKFKEARAHGNLSLDGDSLLDASVSIEGHWEKEWSLADPRLGGFTVWLGPVPIKIDFYLPLDAGVSLDIELTGSLSVEADFGGSGDFDYTCNSNTCWGSSDFQSFDMVEVTSSIELDIDARVWARAMVRVEVYDDSILHAAAGIKGFVDGELWGYYGNACGDGDGDGQNETVQALTAEAWAGYDFAFKYGGIFVTDRYWESTGGRFYLGWTDLLGEGGSTALSPIVEGPRDLEVGTAAEYTVRMRPCYKYDKAVNLTMTPGDWQGNLVIPNPKSSDAQLNRAVLQGTFDQEGWYSMQARALSDAQGRRLRAITEKPIHATLSFCDADTSNPSVAFTSPTQGATLPFGPVVLSANASDDVGVEKVQFFINNTLVSADTEAPFTHNWNATPGTHQLKARVYDLCDKFTTQTITVTIEDVDACQSDSSPPSVSLDAPVDGSIFDVGNVGLAASASDANGIASVQFLVNGSVVANDTNSPFAATWNAGAGTHVVQAKATDGCGLQSLATASVTVMGSPDCGSDNQDPSIAMTYPTATSALTPGFINIQANANDASGIERVQFFVDNVLEHADFTAPFSYSWNASPGSHSLRIRAIDSCNNMRDFTRTVVVGDPDGCSADSVKPVVQLLNPANNAVVAAGQAMTLEATATDASGIEKVQFFVNNQLLGADFSAPFEFAWTPAMGSHQVKARAWDNCSNFKADTNSATAQ